MSKDRQIEMEKEKLKLTSYLAKLNKMVNYPLTTMPLNVQLKGLRVVSRTADHIIVSMSNFCVLKWGNDYEKSPVFLKSEERATLLEMFELKTGIPRIINELYQKYN